MADLLYHARPERVVRVEKFDPELEAVGARAAPRYARLRFEHRAHAGNADVHDDARLDLFRGRKRKAAVAYVANMADGLRRRRAADHFDRDVRRVADELPHRRCLVATPNGIRDRAIGCWAAVTAMYRTGRAHSPAGPALAVAPAASQQAAVTKASQQFTNSLLV